MRFDRDKKNRNERGKKRRDVERKKAGKRKRKRKTAERQERSVQSLGISPWNHVTSDGMYSGNGHVYISLLPYFNHRPPSTAAAATFVEAFADRDAFYATCLLSRWLKYVTENTRHIWNCCLRHAPVLGRALYRQRRDVSLHCCSGWDQRQSLAREIYLMIRKHFRKSRSLLTPTRYPYCAQN